MNARGNEKRGLVERLQSKGTKNNNDDNKKKRPQRQQEQDENPTGL